AAFAPCTSPASYSALGDGTHTFRLRAHDGLGNESAAAASWTVDATPPTVTIAGAPHSPTSATGAALTLSASEAASFRCRLDGAAFAACTSPVTYTGLSDGAHTFRVEATD